MPRYFGSLDLLGPVSRLSLYCILQAYYDSQENKIDMRLISELESVEGRKVRSAVH